MYNNAIKVPINVKFQFRLKFKNNSLILFWIKDKKKVVKEQPKPTVTDTLKEQFGDVMNEGPAYEYAGYMKNIENL